MSRDGGLTSEVALKVLRRDIDPDGQAVQRLRDEGRLLSQLNHPSILNVHDLVVLAGRIALITEYVDGDDLSAFLRPTAGAGRIGPRALLQVVARIASALDAAWTAEPPGADGPLRMVHRDIKPSNIRVSRHGQVKLLDFGIARTDAVDREARTRTDMMVGSPAYMAPERFLERDILLESDVFSLGAVLFEGLAPDRFYGDLPVPMQVGLAVDAPRFASHLEGRLALVRGAPELLDLLQRTLSYTPTDRPTPAELAQQCDALADTLDGPTLAQFCRARSWSDPRQSAAVTGELDGFTITEGLERAPTAPAVPSPASAPSVDPTLTLERASDSPLPARSAPESPRGDGSFLGWALVSIGGLGLVGTAVVGVLALVGVVTLPFALAPESGDSTEPAALGTLQDPSLVAPDPPSEPEPEPPSPDPEPVPAPRPAPQPDPAPAPMPAEPAPPAPEPVPAPDPAPEPAPIAVPTGHVAVEAAFPVYAVVSTGPVRLPADLPPGSWPLQAAFNGIEVIDAKMTVVVASGGRATVRCSDRFQRCTVD